MLQNDRWERGGKKATSEALMNPEKNQQKHADDSAQKGPGLNQTENLAVK